MAFDNKTCIQAVYRNLALLSKSFQGLLCFVGEFKKLMSLGLIHLGVSHDIPCPTGE